MNRATRVTVTSRAIRLSEINRVLPLLCEECREQIESLPVSTSAAEDNTGKVCVHNLLAQFASDRGIQVDQIRGPSRSVWLVRARRQFCRKAHRLGFSTVEIGRAIYRHHTSVVHLMGETRRVGQPRWISGRDTR